MSSKVDVRTSHTFNANFRQKAYDVTLSGSYPASGDPVDLSADFATIDSVKLTDAVDLSNQRILDPLISGTTVLIRSFEQSLAETSGGTNLSSRVVRMVVEGIPLGGVDNDEI